MTRLDQVKRLAELDYTNREIADVIGVRSTRTVIRLKRRAGVPPKNPVAYPQEIRDEIRRLSEEEGWPVEEIVATLGVPYEVAQRWSVRGPGEEWRNIAARLAMKHRTLWNELRGKV